jgi:hypothetical protein
MDSTTLSERVIQVKYTKEETKSTVPIYSILDEDVAIKVIDLKMLKN